MTVNKSISENQQRHRGLASWAESPCVWKVPASFVPPDPSSSSRGPSDISSDQACVQEVTAHPKTKFLRPPNQDLQPLVPAVQKIALAGVHVVSAIVSKDFSMGIAA